ncbi:hypothetical protein KBI52_18080 [Microvirga sp. HBU67558]|nr:MULTISPECIES: hypothetical protein [unclassified Microvirga]MBQ0822102.1 hypothetical protein [Microvirga sp. HBU67558]
MNADTASGRGKPRTKGRDVRDQGLFPSEAEIARRLSQEPAEWASKAKVLEREGLPKIDPIMGGRHWPSVNAYFNRRYGLSTIEVFPPDGEENLDAI